MGRAVPAVRGERLGELAGEDSVDHLLLLLPDGRVYPPTPPRAHRHHQATPGEGAGAAGADGAALGGEMERRHAAAQNGVAMVVGFGSRRGVSWGWWMDGVIGGGRRDVHGFCE